MDVFEKRVLTVLALTALSVAVILIVIESFNVVLLILAGVLIAVYFRGLSYWLLDKTKLSEGKSLAIVIAGTIVLGSAIIWLIGDKIQDQLTSLVNALPSSVQEFKKELSRHDLGRQILSHSQTIEDILSRDKAMGAIKKIFKTTFGVLGDIYIIIFIGVFFTADPSIYKRSIIALIPNDKKENGNIILSKIGITLRDWLIGKIFAMFVVAILTAIGLVIIGIPMPLALALIAGILNFIPNFGPIIAMIPAVLLSISKGTNTAFIVVALYILIQVLESNFITPQVQKRLIQIPPAYIIIGQVTMAILTGGLGVILATPIIAILMVLIQSLYIDQMKNSLPAER